MKSLKYNYKDDFRGPGDGCRVCTGRLEIDSDGDLVCYYCSHLETKRFDYYEWKLWKLEQEQTEALLQPPCFSMKKPNLLTQLKNFFRNK